MSIESEINRIKNAKYNIINSLKSKNIQIEDNASIDQIDVVMNDLHILDTSDATATEEDITKDKSAYVNGKKIVGTMEVNNNNSLIDTVIKSGSSNYSGLNAIIKEVSENLTIEGTSASYMFSYCSSLEKIKSIDISNATSMSYMFQYCRSLKEIPALNTNKVTNMAYMFQKCTSITKIPALDTSKVTSMQGMFSGCTNLTAVPEFNTSNVTTMDSTFQTCTSITEIPALDTSKVTRMTNMFLDCTNLTTVPEFNTSKLVSYYNQNMFKNCPNLSDESLNNILAMCINAIGITNTGYKKLSYMGLTSDQATRCQSLSNYQAFLDAGWVTGY